ncbi:tetratricopeptide repeat protein [Reyranella sp.]|jgi:tetratricopeptide (TPR) repeat protein|uniref:tetratricopeptide repeat protein n=1 Tax=Reyranella sp. TaxID=1929291 RepID=UPI002F9249C7
MRGEFLVALAVAGVFAFDAPLLAQGSLKLPQAAEATPRSLKLPQLAQAPSSPSTPATVTPSKSEYDAAFQQTMEHPADLDVLFKFATIASQTGDLEGAISALERMLLINPNLPRVRLELGVLYYRLGSYEVARTYLDGALKSPELTPEVRQRAEQFMAQIAKDEQRSRFSGEVFLGWRYQSNANLGPATSNVVLFGQAANLNQASLGQPDWGVVGSVQLRHVYDFGRQDKSALETLFTAYANRQFQVSQANVSLLDLTSGPRFQILSGTFEDVTLKPFATVGAIWVNDTPYYASYGAGLEGSVLLSDRLRNTTTFVWRRQDYPDTWYLPTNSQFTGAQYTGTTIFQFQLSPVVTLYGNGSWQQYETASTPWQNYTLWGVGGGMVFRFTDPLFKTALPWTVNLSANEQWWRYDQPDPTIDPNTFRFQNDTILNVVFSVPFDERTTFSLSGGRFVRGATVPNYAFENNSFMFGVSWRF